MRPRGARARHKRLARPRWPIHERALGGFDSNVVEAFLMGHGQHDRLDELLDLLVEASHVVELLGGLLVHLHRLDPRVELRGQHLQDQVRVLVHAHEVRGLE